MHRDEDLSRTGLSTLDHEPYDDPGASHQPVSVPAFTVLGHPDLQRIGFRVLLGELISGREVLLSRRQPRFSSPDGIDSTFLEDRHLSRKPLILAATSPGFVLRRDQCRTRVRVAGEELGEQLSISPQQVDEGVVLELAERVVLLLHRLPGATVGEAPERYGLIGDSAALLRVRDAIHKVSELEIPVLIVGETGTGKELVARALHDNSRRRDHPFLAVNLGALAPSLAAAELFGAKKGAYTGAVRDQEGYFKRADGGTLFLDEIGEAPPEVQVMLLRALETGEITPVGSPKPQRVDVRVLSATDADLDQLVASGRFRAPLLHRLAGYTIQLPALRQRRDDIARLLIHFLRLESTACGAEPPVNRPETSAPWLPAEIVSRAVAYDWPGNVRQLRSMARHLVIHSRGQASLSLDAWGEGLLPRTMRQSDDAIASKAESSTADETKTPRRRRKPSELTSQELLEALRRNRFNLKATASDLGISRTSLYALIERSESLRSAADIPPGEIREAYEKHAGDLAEMVAELEVSERALRQRLKDLGLR